MEYKLECPDCRAILAQREVQTDWEWEMWQEDCTSFLADHTC
jgi:hypothetical protein